MTGAVILLEDDHIFVKKILSSLKLLGFPKMYDDCTRDIYNVMSLYKNLFKSINLAENLVYLVLLQIPVVNLQCQYVNSEK